MDTEPAIWPLGDGRTGGLRHAECCYRAGSSSGIWSLRSRREGSSHRLLVVTVARLWHDGSIPAGGNNRNMGSGLDFVLSERRELNPRSRLGKGLSHPSVTWCFACSGWSDIILV